MDKHNFLPVSREDLAARGWKELDVILVTGDAYVDHPSFGAAVIGRVLEAEGFKVGVIAQPDWSGTGDFLKLGRPKLFFGVTAGNLDSILSNYTINRKKRHKDYYSPGGKAGLRPNRATVVYANKIRELFPGVPVVLGGLESSLRRLAHYDWWDDAVRRSILMDAKADLLVYGMGEKAAAEIARRLAAGETVRDLVLIPGTVIVRNDLVGFGNAVMIPSFEEVKAGADSFNEAFRRTYGELDPFRGKTVAQKHGNRFVIQFPPPAPLSSGEFDRIYELHYARQWHPVYDPAGGVPGFEVVRFSVVSNRGCAGECSFCSLYVHQGRIVQSRSRESILREIRLLAGRPDFKGVITDIGGPTANLYEAFCELWTHGRGACRDKKCLFPAKCRNLKLGYSQSLGLWEEALKIPGVKHVFIASGLRYDLLIDAYADEYLRALCARHVSGQMKVAPEHISDSVLKLMYKPSADVYRKFRDRFEEVNRGLGKKQFLVNYFISAHPGASVRDAQKLSAYLRRQGMHPEQIQDFIPFPMTISGCMYYTGKDPFTGEEVYAAKSEKERRTQRALIQYQQPRSRKFLSRRTVRDLDWQG